MKLKQLASIVGLLVLIALVVPFLIYAIPGLVGAEYSFIVLSGSMEPSISPGDAVIVSESSPEQIAVDDVITFTRGSQETPVTHRVIGIESTPSGLLFETKGDNNPEADASPVPEANVLGTVTLTIPYIGYIVQAANSPIGFVLLVVAPITLFVITELWAFLRSRGTNPTDTDGESEDEQRPAVASGGQSDDSDGPEVSGGSEISFSPQELGLALAVLALATPYAVYVAVQMPGALTIGVAAGAAILLLSIGSLWLLGQFGDTPGSVGEDEDTPVEFDAATDGGTAPEEAR